MRESDCFILIGGRSSRLGTDKAFVELGNRTLLQRAADTVREALNPPRLTAVAANSMQFAINAIVADIPFIFDLHENRGPLGGLHAALAHAKTHWIFLLACDYPSISPDLIRLVGDKITDDNGAIVPQQQDGRMQPLCGFYRVDVTQPVVEQVLDRPRVPPPMHEIVGELEPLVVEYSEYAHLQGAEKFFVNINTPEDLAGAMDSM